MQTHFAIGVIILILQYILHMHIYLSLPLSGGEVELANQPVLIISSTTDKNCITLAFLDSPQWQRQQP